MHVAGVWIPTVYPQMPWKKKKDVHTQQFLQQLQFQLLHQQHQQQSQGLQAAGCSRRLRPTTAANRWLPAAHSHHCCKWGH